MAASSEQTVSSLNTSSKASSITSARQGSPPILAQNGPPPKQEPLLKPLPEEQTKGPASVASVKERLTRMFSNRAESSVPSTGQGTPKAAAAAKSPSPKRKGSSSDKGSDRLAAAPATKPKTSASLKEPPARFVLNPDVPGGHEHNLRSSRRQEKLSDILKALIGKRSEQPTEEDLSLVSSWVHTLKNEKGSKEASPVDKKPATAEVTMTLVQKYGKCHEIVGRGAFGIVRISHKKLPEGEKLFAVKEFCRRPEESERKYSKRLTAEFCISSSLRHSNVIHTLDLLKDAKGDYCEVMEYCAGGDLYTLVLTAGKLETHEADCFFKQMMRGVEYLHEMGVAHRDLKPENLLLTTRGAIKITDFGNGECFRMAWENDAHMVSGLCGSAPYIAPEEYTDKEFDARAVDVWACGVIYMAMRTGRHLWRVAKKEDDEFYARYLEGRRDEEGYAPIESLHRARCRNVIYSILDPNPSRRITASQVLRSEWGREIRLCKAGEEGL